MESDNTLSGAGRSPKPGRAKRRLTILLVVVVVIVAGLGVAWYQVAGKLRMSEPYRAVMALVEKDRQVAERLGQPVHDTWLPPSGSVAGDNADLTFKVAGPKGQASVHAEAKKFAGEWAVRTVEVRFADDSKRISLDTSAGKGGSKGDAPIWKPKRQDSPKAEVETPKLPPLSSSTPDIQVDLPDVAAPTKPPADSKPPAPKSPGK
jgi:hypothetical protein